MNTKPTVVVFKPRNKQTGRNVDDYLLKEGVAYFVLKSSDEESFIVKNGVGMLVRVLKSDVEIIG